MSSKSPYVVGTSDPSTGERNTALDSPDPASMGEVLYLIGAHCPDAMHEPARTRLDRARICFIRGNIHDALNFVNDALQELDDSTPAHRDVLAFRMFVGAMLGESIEQWVRARGEGDDIDSLEVVALCLEANEAWHVGDLTRGLWLSQTAAKKSDGVIPMWRLYAHLLLAKKLLDIGVSQPALRVISDVRTIITGSGLFGFSSIPPALLAVLDLQEGRFGAAIEKSEEALGISVQQSSAVSVKLALSVSAMAYLGQGDQESAAKALGEYHSHIRRYAYPDSTARAAVAEIAIIAAQEGPGPAVEQIHATWRLLASESGCFVEDPARAAWLVALARRAGDMALARRLLQALERLARNNPGVPVLESAADHARVALSGGSPGVLTPLDGAVPLLRETSASDPVPPGAHARTPFAPPTAAPSADVTRSRVASLTPREIQIARHAGRGLTNQQIANTLELSPHTVSFHLRNVFRKLSITTRVMLSPHLAQFDSVESA
ncbi:LuxR C-terminal-related transcriptional regulator [Streptomyces monticola]|uniref:LuxR C-terminal-related transcriptional regulator n=1 Tax=Streptomyces monticola TaxID=2666263 RepID=A0ABW2JVK6_9ACTN